jgi:hypothetical protein
MTLHPTGRLQPVPKGEVFGTLGKPLRDSHWAVQRDSALASWDVDQRGDTVEFSRPLQDNCPGESNCKE